MAARSPLRRRSSPRPLLRLLVAGLASLQLACAHAHGDAPYPNPSRVAQGAIVGSMAGAAIGAGLDHRDRGRGALVGAVGGLLAGALFGGKLEEHHRWHRAFHDYDPHHDEWCDGDHPWDDEHGDHRWDDDPGYAEPPVDDPPEPHLASRDVLFERGEAELSRGARSHLRRVADLLADEPDLELLLRGHTDGSGEEDFDLSEQRARRVRAFLTEEGAPARRIAWVGFGDTQPVASPDSREGRQRNRRVEIVLRPRDEDPFS